MHQTLCHEFQLTEGVQLFNFQNRAQLDQTWVGHKRQVIRSRKKVIALFMEGNTLDIGVNFWRVYFVVGCTFQGVTITQKSYSMLTALAPQNTRVWNVRVSLGVTVIQCAQPRGHQVLISCFLFPLQSYSVSKEAPPWIIHLRDQTVIRERPNNERVVYFP